METEETRALTERFLAARGTADPEQIVPFLADDVIWVTPPSMGIGTFEGKETVAAALSGKAAGRILKLETVRRETRGLIVEGETAVALVTMEATTQKDEDYRNDYAWVFTWRDELLTRIDEFTDTLHSARLGFVKL